ncbi:MAG: helix-turn-helix domain-containing protein [Pseudomonadota bacterium]
MPNLQHDIAIIGAFQGLLLFGLLLTDTRVSQASRLVGLICLVLALMFCLQLVLAQSVSGPLVFLTGWLFYLPASLGGLGYLYCRNAILDQRLAWRDLLHLSPVLVCYLLVADYVVFQPEALLRWISGEQAASWRIVWSEYVLFSQALFYIPVTIRMILRLRAQARVQLANFNPAIFDWLLTFTSSLFVFWALKAVFALTNVEHPQAFSLAADIFIVILIYLVAAAQWRHPQLFLVEQLNKIPRSSPTPPTSGSLLDVSTQAELYETIKDKVESQRLFQQPGLTLASLAEAAGLSTHHLSEVLNQHAGKNFYEFINGYRIDFVRRRFEEDQTSKVLDIAMEAGFASKSTFNAIFKQYTGKTPTQYRQSLMTTDV